MIYFVWQSVGTICNMLVALQQVVHTNPINMCFDIVQKERPFPSEQSFF